MYSDQINQATVYYDWVKKIQICSKYRIDVYSYKV